MIPSPTPLVSGVLKENSLHFWYTYPCQKEQNGPHLQRIVVVCFDLSCVKWRTSSKEFPSSYLIQNSPSAEVATQGAFVKIFIGNYISCFCLWQWNTVGANNKLTKTWEERLGNEMFWGIRIWKIWHIPGTLKSLHMCRAVCMFRKKGPKLWPLDDLQTLHK